MFFKNSTKNELILTTECEEILDILENTTESIFITGKAGTGKSSLLKHFIEQTYKKVVVLAPTGVASLNVGGQTIHSFFRFPPAIINPNTIRADSVREELFDNLEMIIIDEVSMVRSDVMHGIDVSLRINRMRPNEPFGGVQMVFVGDLFQLPPVLKSNERHYILKNYGGQYFFDAPVFNGYAYHFRELSRVFRQSEEQVQFKTLLNNIRNNTVNHEDMDLLNSRHKEYVGEQKDALFLTTRRDSAKNSNSEKLSALWGKERVFIAKLTGKYTKFKELDEDTLDNKFPAPYKLVLKKNARIMMLKNDPQKRWVNGSVGKVIKMTEEAITIKIDHHKYVVKPETWSEVRYLLNKDSGNIEGETTASFTQFPMCLAYAMTIHKSQGKTFDDVTIDIGMGAFAHGQLYVALSRCKTLSGIVLNNVIKNTDIIVDPRITEYHDAHTQQHAPPVSTVTADSIRAILKDAINNNTTIRIEYQKGNGDIHSRTLSNVGTPGGFGNMGQENRYISAFCHTRGERRNFQIDKIVGVEEVG